MYLDVSIQTNSADRSKIFLKAGQKIIVLKSPRGICLQLESGKVIAIRASMKAVSNNSNGSQGELKDSSGIQEIINTNNRTDLKNPKPIAQAGDIIDMTNSDDEDNASKQKSFGDSDIENLPNHKMNTPEKLDTIIENSKDEVIFKDKAVYKPNLIQRKSKTATPSSVNTTSVTSTAFTASPAQPSYSNHQSSYETDFQLWNRFPNKTESPSHSYRDGSSENEQQSPYRTCKFQKNFTKF